MDQLVTESRLQPQYRIVSWDEAWELGRELMEAHCAEWGIPDLVKYIGSVDEIRAAEAEGNLVLGLAFAPEAAGYIFWKIGWHQGLAAQAGHLGPWYLRPEYRGSGIAMGLLRHSWQSLKYRGIRWACMTLPIKHQRRTPFGIGYEMNYLRDLFPEAAGQRPGTPHGH